MKWRRLLNFSVINTIRFNYRYFGVKGLLHLYILVSKFVKIDNLSGKIICKGIPSRGCIKIGFERVGIADCKYRRTIWNNTGMIQFDNRVDLGQGTILVNTGILVFGENFSLKANSTIICHKKISFGKNNLVSWDVLFMDTDHHEIYENETKQLLNPPKEIIIGDDVWIGCRVTIMKGTVIGNGGGNSSRQYCFRRMQRE